MKETKLNSQDIKLWDELTIQEKAYKSSLSTFLSQSQNPLLMIKTALSNPTQRATALQLCFYLTVEERQTLFNQLIELASVGHSDIHLVRQVLILSLPKPWLKQHLEAGIKPLLQQGTDEEYRRLLELIVDLDLHLSHKIIQKALSNSNPDIQEVGEDFLPYLKSNV